MTQNLKTFVVNMKSLDQDIDDPIVGAGDANGRTFRIIFTQEAAAQFTPETKVYLKWQHKQLNIRGYNVFTELEEATVPTWEIHYPKAMLHTGDVLCRIEIVDEISIAPSTNFIVHVLEDPDDGSNFIVSDDYSIFNQAVIDMNKMTSQIDEYEERFESMSEDFGDMWEDVNLALRKANAAIDVAQCALKRVDQVDSATGIFITEY